MRRLKQKMIRIKDECSRSEEEAINKAINKLPSTSQKEAVKAIFNASKKTDLRGIRYTNDWVYECLLLRIKSSKTYTHLRSQKILALPTAKTLKRYMNNIKGTYGYDEGVFKLLKKQTASMAQTDLRGE